MQEQNLPASASVVLVNKVDSENGKTVELSETGTCVGYLREYADGNKYLAVIDDVHFYCSQQRIVMNAEEWIFNSAFNFWAQNSASSKRFEARKLNVGMNVRVRLSDGKYSFELDEEELAEATLVPEYLMYWNLLSLPHFVPAAQLALEKRWFLDYYLPT